MDAEDIVVPPRSRIRQRFDGGRDLTFRVNFQVALSAASMHRICALLLDAVNAGAAVGIVALTKVEIIEPDTCEYRYWAVSAHDEQITLMHDLWLRINEVAPIGDVDGVRYPWLGTRAGVKS